jgi:nucleoside-diphosphate-sugar epimerase
MRILVTGATGKVGSRFVPRLLAKGHEARLLVRDDTKAERLVKLGAEIAIGDLNDVQSLAVAVEGMEAVAHIAAYFLAANDDGAIFRTNHDGTVALARAAQSAGVKRFVFVSTGMAYGSDDQQPARGDDPRDPAGLPAYTARRFVAGALCGDYDGGRACVFAG